MFCRIVPCKCPGHLRAGCRTYVPAYESVLWSKNAISADNKIHSCHQLPLMCHVQCLYMTWHFVSRNFKRRSNLARKCVLCSFPIQLEKQKFCSKRISHIVKSDRQFTIVTIRMKYVKLSFDLQNSACVFAVGVPFVILYLKFSGNSCSGRRR